MLHFPDGTRVRVNGLDEILADLFAGGRQPDQATGEEIVNRLEARRNFIPSSGRTRNEYLYVLLKEYKNYIDEHTRGNAG
jgi:hypothetical protein